MKKVNIIIGTLVIGLSSRLTPTGASWLSPVVSNDLKRQRRFVFQADMQFMPERSP